MKILYIANVAGEHICKFYLNEFKKMSELGHCVDVACRLDSDVPYVSRIYPMPWKRSPFHFSTFGGIKKVKKIIETGNYDIVYCTTPIGGLIGRLAAKQVKKYHPAVIYIAHGFHFFHGSSFLSWLIFFPVEKWLSKYTDVLITINDEDYQIALTKFSAKKVVQINGIGANLHKYQDISMSEEQIRILKNDLGTMNRYPILYYAAEISALKNQKMLLSVLRLLQERGFSPALLLPGEDETNGKFSRLIKKKKMDGCVRLLGFRKDCEQIIRTADFCTPSSTREGLGINIIEAMASGIPIVATNNRGHRQSILTGKNGFLVDINDSQAMANNICSLISNPSLKNEIVQNALKTSGEYGWDKVFPSILKIYQFSVKEFTKKR
jgi:glycosyltransferase EpsD